MSRNADLPDVLPMFPLAGALMLPRAHLPLHVFEPRYLAMVEDALKSSHRMIGVVQPVSESGQAFYPVGGAGRITQFSETDDGRYMITLTGRSRFQISDEIEGFTPYRRCGVAWGGYERDLEDARDIAPPEREALLQLLDRYLVAQDLSADWEALREAGDEMLVNALSMMLEFSVEEKQALLEAPSLAARQQTLMTLIEFGLRGQGATEERLQ